MVIQTAFSFYILTTWLTLPWIFRAVESTGFRKLGLLKIKCSTTDE